jgi:hypothetical protein
MNILEASFLAMKKAIASLARKLTSYLNRVSGSFSGIMAQAHWMASQYVHTAGLRIMRGSKA